MTPSKAKRKPSRSWAFSLETKNSKPKTQNLADVLGDRGFDLFLLDESDDLFLHLSALEDQQRRDAADAEARWGSRILVDIHLGDLHLAAIGAGQLVHNGGDGLARAAPGGPKIDQHGALRLQDFLLKASVGDFNDSVGCHFLSEKVTRKHRITWPMKDWMPWAMESRKAHSRAAGVNPAQPRAAVAPRSFVRVSQAW